MQLPALVSDKLSRPSPPPHVQVNIDKILGFGSMGIVYFGQLFDTKVIIKLIEHGTGVLGKEQVRLAFCHLAPHLIDLPKK